MTIADNVHSNSLILHHKDMANFLANILPEMSIKPYFDHGSIIWYIDGILVIKNEDHWIMPEVQGISPLDVINKAYRIYVVNQPVIKGDSGEFQVNSDRTITYNVKRGNTNE